MNMRNLNIRSRRSSAPVLALWTLGLLAGALSAQTTTLFSFEDGAEGWGEPSGWGNLQPETTTVSVDASGTGATDGTAALKIELGAGGWQWAAAAALQESVRVAISDAAASASPMSLYGDVTVVKGTNTTGWLQMGMVLQLGGVWAQTPEDILQPDVNSTQTVTFEQPLPYGSFTLADAGAGWGNMGFYFNFDGESTGLLTIYLDNIRVGPASSATPTSWWSELAADEDGWRHTATAQEYGIGWIWDAAFPWVYTLGLGDPSDGDWLYLDPAGDRSVFYAYNADGGYWIYALPGFGWYYSWETGHEGWNRFNR
jgi:hypothetical protein